MQYRHHNYTVYENGAVYLNLEMKDKCTDIYSRFTFVTSEELEKLIGHLSRIHNSMKELESKEKALFE